jgi:hypothetical protein
MIPYTMGSKEYWIWKLKRVGVLEKRNTTAEYDIRVDCPWYVLKNLSHANTHDTNEAYTQWICLPPAVDVVGKRKTIQFTVICVMITIVQKTVILKSMLDLGRSFSCRLSGCFASVIRRASCNYDQILEDSSRNFGYLLV